MLHEEQDQEDEEAILNPDSESEISEADDPEYAPQGQAGVVGVPGSPASLDEDSFDDTSSEESSEEETQSDRMSEKGSYWNEHPPTQGRTRSHNILRCCPGPASGLSTVSPKDAWDMFISNNIIEEVLHCTNLEGRRAAAAKRKEWRRIEKDEFMAFIGLTLLAGGEKSWDVSVRELFCDPLQNPMYKATMGVRRYEDIRSFMQFDDKRTRPIRQETDHMAAFRSVWDCFLVNCRRQFIPSDCVTVDEQLVPSKPAKYGIKIFWMCDARIPYAIDAMVYTGRQPGEDVQKNLGEKIVEQLCSRIRQTDPEKVQAMVGVTEQDLMEDGTGIPSPSKIKSFLGMVVFYQQYIEGCSHLGKLLFDLTSGMKKPRHGKGLERCSLRPQECGGRCPQPRAFVRPSVFHRLTRVPYGALLEEARALNTDCVQDVFRWSCHPFEMDGRSHCPGARPSTDTVVANCTAVIGSQDPHITPREVCAVLSRCQSQDEYAWPHAYLLPQLTQGLQPSPQSEVHVLSRQELMEMQRADTCLSRVLFFVERQRRPSRRERTHEAVDVLRLLRHWERLSVKMGVLYHVSKNIISRKKSFQYVVPAALREKVLQGVHDEAGHQGQHRTLSLARQHFYWHGLDKDVKEYDSSNKSVDVLVVTDHFTKLAQAYPCSNQSAKVVARQLWNNFFCTYGFPERVHSDQGANFESSLIAEMLQVAGIQKSHTTPYHPMGNGCVERFNRTLGNMIRALPPVLGVAALNAYTIFTTQHPEYIGGVSHARRLFIKELGKELVMPYMKRRMEGSTHLHKHITEAMGRCGLKNPNPATT
ncbi:hypothetical protein AAFF_G00350030 [Aldrovandia affinis]|uniref:Gypsy retrotransposon integrase-like protein 1 n=1 Tax=Aldrovandia affinis TaxID=143900 RepID=A0AAD7WNQ7_9TELE|nr:hypothetical protein AAFF_G00350030 [Aldrovandia affinis]